MTDHLDRIMAVVAAAHDLISLEWWDTLGTLPGEYDTLRETLAELEEEG